MTAKKWIESQGLSDSNYMDSGIIPHITEMCEKYAFHVLSDPKGTMRLVEFVYKEACGKPPSAEEAERIIHDYIHPPK